MVKTYFVRMGQQILLACFAVVMFVIVMAYSIQINANLIDLVPNLEITPTEVDVATPQNPEPKDYIGVAVAEMLRESYEAPWLSGDRNPLLLL